MPRAVCGGSRRLVLSVDRHGHGLTRFSQSPDLVLLSLLKNHMIAENIRQFDIGLCRRANENGGNGNGEPSISLDHGS